MDPEEKAIKDALKGLAWFILPLIALLLLFSGCPGEPPTQPSPSPTPSPSPSSTPAPIPTPSICPQLSVWGSKIHNIYDKNGNGVEAPVREGFVVVDSTPKFNGEPCNAENPGFCGGRRCEDPRGPEWRFISPSKAKGINDGFQAKFGPLRPGLHKWVVCPRPDVVDGEGQPVPVSESPCSTGEFTVP